MVRRGKKRKVVVRKEGAVFKATYGNREFLVLRGGIGNDLYVQRKYRLTEVSAKDRKTVIVRWVWRNVGAPCKTISDVKRMIESAA